jgi:hypothetical protein
MGSGEVAVDVLASPSFAFKDVVHARCCFRR